MDFVSVGSTGVQVSPLCLGTMSFGSEADEATAAAMFARARDKGINFFDTADVYGAGASEEILGRLVAGSRDDVVITSKVFYATGAGPNDSGLSRRHIRTAVEASLYRLGTDRIDFYFVHAFDDRTPIEQTLRALDDLVRQGKILYPAVSNWAAWQIATALGIQTREGLTRFELVQPMYNVVRRQAEVEILPLARAEGLGVISYSPLGGGLLTGKYAPQLRPSDGRLVANPRYADRYGLASDYLSAEAFTAVANRVGHQPASLAVAWAMANPDITAPIVGARNLDQLDASLAALDIDVSPDLYAEVAATSSGPATATDRTEVQTGRWT